MNAALLAEAEGPERALLGSLLVNPELVERVTAWLLPDAFSTHRHRTCYRAMVACGAIGMDVDLVTLQHGYAMIRAADAYDVVWLSGLAIDLPSSFRGDQYAEQVASMARRRLAVTLGAKLQQQALTGEVTLEEDYTKQLAAIARPASDDLIVPYDEALPGFLDRLTRQRNGELPRDVVPTGFRGIDDALLGGWNPADLVIIGARPSMGKSAFMLQLAHNAARYELTRSPAHPRQTVIFSAEMTMEALHYRAVAEVTEFSAAKLRTNGLRDAEWAELHDRIAGMRRLPIGINDTTRITTERMRRAIDRYQRTHGQVRTIFFDFIELAGDGAGEGDTARVSRIVEGLDHLGKETGATVIALSQLNRAVEGREDKMPTLADLRQSGMIEQLADRVLFLFRQDYYAERGMLKSPDPMKVGIAEVNIAKNREGAGGVFRLRFLPALTAFRDLEE